MKLLVAGATGLVGSLVATEAESQGHHIVTVGRRSSNLGIEEVITDFSETVKLPAADAAICALGTTIAAAGSREAFYKVDHDAVVTFAKSALDAGITHFLMVTAVGASPNARVYYSRVKGETERDIASIGFSRVDIVQPGLLLGARDENRPVEKLLQRLSPIMDLPMRGPLNRYASIAAQVVARSMITLCGHVEPGIYRHDNRAMQRLSRQT